VVQYACANAIATPASERFSIAVEFVAHAALMHYVDEMIMHAALMHCVDQMIMRAALMHCVYEVSAHVDFARDTP
jgi:hypothetical protein